MSEFEETVAATAAPSTTIEDATAEPVAASTDTATTDTAKGADAPRSARKVREGNVVSDKMEKTVVVAVIERIRHPKYGKFMMRTKKLYAHDETNDAHVGDKVRVMETRPLSKNKRWRVMEVLERAK